MLADRNKDEFKRIEDASARDNEGRDARLLRIGSGNLSILPAVQTFMRRLEGLADQVVSGQEAPKKVSFNNVDMTRYSYWQAAINTAVSLGAGALARFGVNAAVNYAAKQNIFTRYLPNGPLREPLALMAGLMTTSLVAMCLQNGDAVINDLEAVGNFFNEHVTEKQAEILATLAQLQIRFILYLDQNDHLDMAEVHDLLNAYTSAVAALSNEFSSQSKTFFEKVGSYFGVAAEPLSPDALQIQSYKMFAAICNAASTAEKTNGFARFCNWAGSGLSRLGFVGRIILLPFRFLSWVSEVCLNYPVAYRFSQPQREMLATMSGKFEAATQLIEAAKRDDKVVVAQAPVFTDALTALCPLTAQVGWLSDSSIFTGAAEAWLTQYKIFCDANIGEEAREALRPKLREIQAQYERQMETYVNNPASIRQIIRNTMVHMTEAVQQDAPHAEDDKEDVSGAGVDMGAVEIKREASHYRDAVAVQVLQLIKRLNTAKLGQDVMQNLQSFYTGTLKGSEVAVSVAMHPNSVAVFDDSAKRLALAMSTEEGILCGSSVVWLILNDGRMAQQADRVTNTLSRENIAAVLQATRQFNNKLFADNPSLCEFYRMLLIKQLAEVWAKTADQVVKVAVAQVLENELNVDPRHYKAISEMAYGQVSDLNNLFYYLLSVMPFSASQGEDPNLMTMSLTDSIVCVGRDKFSSHKKQDPNSWHQGGNLVDLFRVDEAPVRKEEPEASPVYGSLSTTGRVQELLPAQEQKRDGDDVQQHQHIQQRAEVLSTALQFSRASGGCHREALLAADVTAVNNGEAAKSTGEDVLPPGLVASS